MDSPTLVLDHVFVSAPAGSPAADALVAAGLVEGPPNVHPGQGTANRRFWFDTWMLELLELRDPGEARHPRTARTGLWQRSRWATEGTSPFGVAWTLPPAAAPPFETWPYRPIYLPDDASIPVATLSDDPRQPLLFVLPNAMRGAASAGHPRTPRRTAGLRLQQPGLHPDVRGLSGVEWADGPPLLTVTLQGASRAVDLRPHGVPLVVAV